LDNIFTHGSGTVEALGPTKQLARVDRGLGDGEGKREPNLERVRGDLLLDVTFVDVRPNSCCYKVHEVRNMFLLKIAWDLMLVRVGYLDLMTSLQIDKTHTMIEMNEDVDQVKTGYGH